MLELGTIHFYTFCTLGLDFELGNAEPMTDFGPNLFTRYKSKVNLFQGILCVLGQNIGPESSISEFKVQVQGPAIIFQNTSFLWGALCKIKSRSTASAQLSAHALLIHSEIHNVQLKMLLISAKRYVFRYEVLILQRAPLTFLPLTINQPVMCSILTFNLRFY